MKICLISQCKYTFEYHFLSFLWNSFPNEKIYLLTDQTPNKDIEVFSKKKKIPMILLGENNIASSLPFLKFMLKIFTTLKALVFLRKLKPDIIITSFITWWGLYGSFSSLNPIISLVWGSDVFHAPKKNLFWKIIVKYNIIRSVCLIGSDYVLKDSIEKITSIKRPFLNWIWAGTYLNNLQNSPKKRKSTLEKLGWNDDSIIIYSNRNLYAPYQVDKLIQIIPKLIKNNEKFRFIISSNGPQLKGFKNYINANNCENNVIFTGKIEQKQVFEFLNVSDIFINIPITDAHSSSLSEALFSEIPCIVSNIPIHANLLNHKENALIIEPKKEEELYSAIIELSSDLELRKKIIRNNRSYVIPKIKKKIDSKKFNTIMNYLLNAGSSKINQKNP